jgi:hypothetical protein
MKKAILGALMAMVLAGCGGPGIKGGPDEDGVIVDPPPPPVRTEEPTLWPLTVGTVWSYKITDDKKGVFTKRVEVMGKKTVDVPGVGSIEATHVRSEQPSRVEHSYQLDSNGVVMRVLEEDFVEGALEKATWWKPSTVKSLSARREASWEYKVQVSETQKKADGTQKTQQETYTWIVLGEESVTVPAGTFTALKVRRERTFEDTEAKVRTYWLVPGIGKVREDGERLEELTGADIKQ